MAVTRQKKILLNLIKFKKPKFSPKKIGRHLSISRGKTANSCFWKCWLLVHQLRIPKIPQLVWY